MSSAPWSTWIGVGSTARLPSAVCGAQSWNALREAARAGVRRCGVDRLLMYLEVLHWHHVKPSLAFNTPHPGQPLIMLYLACAAAPLVVLIGTVTHLRTR
jgi:hypothetical protein